MDQLATRIMLDALEEQGDARAAWEAVAYCLGRGIELPEWVKRYLGQTAVSLLDHLDNRDLRHPVQLARALGFDLLKKRLAHLDPDIDPVEVHREISAWIEQGQVRSIAEGARRYNAVILTGRYSPETIRGWFNEGRKQAS